ncbi:MAG: YjbQ family protein [Phycisphaerales bacterium]|nr:YjbQ family protein [Phycisphaerales bacterium]
MPVETHEITIGTRGHAQVIDLTRRVRQSLVDGAIRNGNVTVFVVGSTAGITTTEFEPGLADHDLAAGFERIAPRDGVYRHEQTWHDDNGHAHVRASILGPGITVPVVNGQLTLGTWQQIVLIDFDTHPRDRRVVIQVVGE